MDEEERPLPPSTSVTGLLQNDAPLPRLSIELWGLVVSYLGPVWQGLARSVCRDWRKAVALASPSFSPSIMVDASFTLERENFRECSNWTVSQGCKRPFLIRNKLENRKAVVLDIGSSSIKCGFADEEVPRTEIPSLVGIPRFNRIMVGPGHSNCYVGHDAPSKRSYLTIHRPIQRGVIEDTLQMEQLFNHIFPTPLLHVDPKEQPVLLTQATRNPKAHGEKLMQILFESFEVPAMYITNQALSTLCAFGRLSGLALCVGEGVTQIMPVDEGHCVRSGVSRSHYAGVDITENLQTLLLERGYDFTKTSAEQDLLRTIKEKVSYTAINFGTEMEIDRGSSQLEVNYELPDGSTIRIGNERFRCIEPLFSPSIDGLEIPGIPQLIHNAIMKCPAHRRKMYYKEILLSGGTSLNLGFDSRIQMEVQKLAPQGVPVQVHAPPERLHSAWLGASIMGSLNSFENLWIDKYQYEENGPSLSHVFA